MNDRQMSDVSDKREFICGVVEGFYGKPWSFEQRKDLFKQLKALNLNSFMYAPKDDVKHRSKWRQPYTDSETEALKELVEEAEACGIDFYYSLAPGLDMVYSDGEDVKTLMRKYDQLVGLGCKSFAILFDDIEPEINEKDKGVFENYAAAQVAVSNIIFEYLNRPKFLFCPTEYCESRAVPDVPSSTYLNTIGAGLDPKIDIMWSGCRVVSRLITEESIEELATVIRRPPLIWENLHANDYDKKRVFLGPYSGRSTKIIPKLRGVLTNPNCEYEANYIAIHTLSQWVRCTNDSSPHNRCNLERRDASELPPRADQSESTYDPVRALRRAIDDWLPRVLEVRNLPAGVDLSSAREDAAASSELAKESDDEVRDVEFDDNNVDMVVPDDTRSSANSEGTNKSDMDTSSSPAVPPPANLASTLDNNSCDSCEMQDAAKNPDSHLEDCPMRVAFGARGSAHSQLNADGLNLLADLFYLPFEHGSHGCALLNDIKWLADNSDIMFKLTSSDRTKGDGGAAMGDEAEIEAEPQDKSTSLWIERASSLSNACNRISGLVNTIIYDCPNKLLTSELYPYLVEMRDLIAVIVDYIRFLRYRTSRLDRFYQQNNSTRQKEVASSDEQEPWAHRGGLIGDVQRLLFST